MTRPAPTPSPAPDRPADDERLPFYVVRRPPWYRCPRCVAGRLAVIIGGTLAVYLLARLAGL